MEPSAVFNEQVLENQRPNFFELVANDAMQEALRPAFRYICKVLVQSRPDLFNWLWQFSEEFFTLLESAIQLYFLSKYGASFSEQFYSLKRSSVCLYSDGLLTRNEVILSLTCLSVVPYLKVKLDRWFSQLQEEDDMVTIRWENGGMALFKYLYFTLYPYLNALWKAVRLVYQLRYLFAQSDCYSPLLWLAGVILKRQLELPSNVEHQSRWLNSLVSGLVAIGVFGLKFLEWWYSAERSTAVRLMTSLPVPPPPKPMQPSTQGIRVPTNPHLCPLCLGHRVEPTTVSVSGYVFCYACILHYLRENHSCPITCLPATQKHLIRIYTNVT